MAPTAGQNVPDRSLELTLAHWGQPAIIRPLSGGSRNIVMEIRLGDQRLAARRSARTPASLDWEWALLDHLASHGVRVPVVIPALDGRRHIDGVMVQTWLEGAAPEPGDWPLVAATLRRVHQLTAGWPQRPGFASTTDLLTEERGGDIDLSAMPADAVRTCRKSWAELIGMPQAVVHGDPGSPNIRVSDGSAGLLDWDEARVDCVDLDLAELPGSYLPPERLTIARTAATAWEVANGWIAEPSYARRQLGLLYGGHHSFG